MKMKEAIEFVENTRYVNSFGETVQNKKVDDIVELLQRGEKYEKMWEKFEKFHREHPNNYCVLSSNDVYKALQNTKQKYFPIEICGTCVSYDSDTCFCSEHPEYGELVEQDTCDDWREDDTIPK